MYFTKEKHETIFYRTSKTIDSLKFKKELNGELMKHDANDIDYEIFYETVLSILNAHAHLKKKQLSANHATFLAKKMQNAVMNRTRLRNTYLKNELKQLKQLTTISETFALVFLGHQKGVILKTLM